MLAQARWNKTTAVNQNSFITKIAHQHDISKSTLTNQINDRKTASIRNQHFQRLSSEEEVVICGWILRLQTWSWSSHVKQVRSIVAELLVKKRNDKSVKINWSQKFLKRHSQIKTAYVSSLDKERAMTQNFNILATDSTSFRV